MTDGASALQLVLGGDPTLYAIVALSLYVSLSAVVLAAIVALPFGALLALTRFPGRTFIVVVINAFMGLPPVVVGLAVYLLLSRSGPLGFPRAPVHAESDDRRAGAAGDADHRGADAPDRRGPVGRVSRRADRAARHARAPRRDLDLGRALLARHDAARGLRPRRGGSRHRDDRRRQYRRLHPHDDDRDRARDVEGRPAARDGARPRAHHADHRRQRARLGRAARRRTASAG